ncbi:catalase [Aquihabitans sp. G128]|uniref:catalase n=1 Tax=Aquihabitans sp. G128 TaxID=2849779 RepID=UPI001C22CDAC|nr:catalase [Aquihabitans sp. G128]QXC60879.1 catalase [Aquihabitans sp. G128]
MAPRKAPATEKAATADPAKETARNTAPRRSPAEQVGGDRDLATSPQWAQQGDAITTATGTPIQDSDNSLRAGSRGPTLLEDHALREKIMHFDHERIPERVVHARGAGAHGTFTVTDPLEGLTAARFLTDTSRTTPVFVRFSTVAGSRGSADTARDVRGFAVKFYTDEGNMDLVGNNIPIFFIQDGIKFPDLIHAAKPEPDREIPQAQTAHDTFWDFASLQPESTAMLLWTMSDRAIPRSYRTMEGFGVHTFRFVADDGSTSLVKFHWKPVLGVHSLVWEESQRLGGIDPDFHRRDLWNAIESGAFPQWDLAVQVMPDIPEQTFEGIDLLDSTKLVPEELCPVRVVGRLTLDRNPTSYFAETEQVAFHTGHLVRGIDITDDPLLHARMFSYLDTQLTRLGGPNFEQLPINRPAAPVNNDYREGYGQQAIHQGRAAYAPNSVGGGCPFAIGDAGYVHSPQPVEGVKVRERAQSFDDHYSQATLFWDSMQPTEQEHIVGAFSFELGKVSDEAIQDRTLANLANVHPDLVERVAANIGRPVPEASPVLLAVDAPIDVSPALSMEIAEPGAIDGRVIGMIVGDGVKPASVDKVAAAITAAGAVLQVIGPRGGFLGSVEVHHTFHTCDSVMFDALVVDPSAAGALELDRKVGVMVQEAYRHHKAVGAIGDAVAVLEVVGIDPEAPGVVTGPSAAKAFTKALVTAVGWHRHWDRTI